MTFAFETVNEEYWLEGEKLLFGKPHDYRVIVWVNYDLISLHKIFYCVEKDRRLTLSDFPLPVFCDEKTPTASLRLDRLHHAIDSSTFAEFPFYSTEENSIEEDYQDFSEEVDDSLEEESYTEEDGADEESYTEEDGVEEEDSSDGVEEKQEDTKEYLSRQFENFLQEVDEFYQEEVRDTFQKKVSYMVEALKSQVKMNS
jgi:hypothetical protein